MAFTIYITGTFPYFLFARKSDRYIYIIEYENGRGIYITNYIHPPWWVDGKN